MTTRQPKAMSAAAGAPAQRHEVIERFWAVVDRGNELGGVLARTMGIHVTDATAIVEIRRAEQQDDPLTPNRLAAEIGLTTGATSLLLNRLEAAGFVERRRGHADRRRVTLHSTPAVHEPVEQFQEPVRSDLDASLAGYSSNELALVIDFLKRFRDVIETHHKRHAA